MQLHPPRAYHLMCLHIVGAVRVFVRSESNEFMTERIAFLQEKADIVFCGSDQGLCNTWTNPHCHLQQAEKAEAWWDCERTLKLVWAVFNIVFVLETWWHSHWKWQDSSSLGMAVATECCIAMKLLCKWGSAQLWVSNSVLDVVQCSKTARTLVLACMMAPSLSLALLVQGWAAQHEAMVELDKLSVHQQLNGVPLKEGELVTSGSVLEHAWLGIERSKRCGVLHLYNMLSVSTSSVACVTLPSQRWAASAKPIQCMSCTGTAALVLLLNLKDISLVHPPQTWCTGPLKEVDIGSMQHLRACSWFQPTSNGVFNQSTFRPSTLSSRSG